MGKTNILNHLLTGSDNETHDIGRWAIAAGTLTIIAVAVPVAILSPEVAVITAVGTALGTFLGGAGILMKGKEHQEPKAEAAGNTGAGAEASSGTEEDD